MYIYTFYQGFKFFKLILFCFGSEMSETMTLVHNTSGYRAVNIVQRIIIIIIKIVVKYYIFCQYLLFCI